MKKIVDFCKICLNHNEKKYDLKEKVRSRPSSFKNGMCQVCEFEIKKKQGKIDWKKRKKILNKLVLESKKKNLVFTTVLYLLVVVKIRYGRRYTQEMCLVSTHY